MSIPGDLQLNGQAIPVDLSDAVSQAQLERVMVGASTLTLTVEDTSRTLLRSPLAQILQPSIPQVDTLSAASPYNPTTISITDVTTGINLLFSLCSIEKESDELTLTFEDYWINRLRYVYAPDGYYTATGTMTRADFMVAVINKALPDLNIPVAVVPDDFLSGLQLSQPAIQQIATDTGDAQWGTSDDPQEDAWSCLVRLANTAQWRCFSDGQRLVMGPDEWLIAYQPAATFVENTGGTDSIDFTWDMGQAQATATVNVNTALLTFPPGVPVILTGMGIADGTWLVSDVSRSLFLPDAQVKLVQAQPSLTEAQIQSDTASSTTSGGQTASTTAYATGTGGSVAAQTAVKYAVAQVGKPYIWGGTGPGGYDCSGLCYAAYASAGVTIPRTSEAQWFDTAFQAVDLSELQPGDLVFYNWGEDGIAGPGHVVMYVGNGNVVEAAHTGTVISVHAMYGGQVGARRPVPGPSSSSSGVLA